MSQLVHLESYFVTLAESCPENFEHRMLMIRAEKARLEGRPYEAAAQYDAAINTARGNDYLRDTAIAQELAGRFYRAQGRDAFARAYLSEARDGYQQYGANAKVEAMQIRHADLLASATWDPEGATSLEMNGLTRSLDQWAVTEACRALSSEIVPERLLDRLTQLVLTGSGAQRCAILLDDDSGNLQVEADANVDRSPSGDLPLSLLRYVRRTGDTVVMGDARRSDEHDRAGYFRNTGTRSVLCTPIDRTGESVGVLYLENNLTAGAFATLETEFLRLLTAQFAISLQTARLYQAVRREVAERQRAEEEVKSLNRHLVRQNQELETILYVTSHDLRAPLVTIGGFTHELISTVGQMQHLLEGHQAMTHLSTEFEEAVSCITRGVARMDTLLSAVSQVGSAAQAPIQPVPFDMTALVHTLRDTFQPQIEALDARLTIGPMPSCYVDPARAHEVLFNLIDNALRHTGTQPRVRIQGRRRGNKVVYAVSDSGPGIDAEWRERIFELFQSAGPAAGQGLGLTVARRIAGDHDGRLWVESEPGQGATFYLSLPAKVNS